jgi:hypothetical protein
VDKLQVVTFAFCGQVSYPDIHTPNNSS